MMFCPKCGSILRPKKDKNRRVMYCSCGYTQKDAKDIMIKETVSKEAKDIPIVPEDEKTLPIADNECPNCKHGKAYYWLVQTRAGDEPETRFFRCVKCKHTWREYK